ncbi:MAG TPA: hypothetical protein VJZ00_05510 [Thermoanaerobaculia bacterium]|nr:hypothetical protein [Thermoanaerobaculia bacterium]
MRRAVACAALFGSLALSGTADAQCSSAQGYARTTAPTIGILNGTGWTNTTLPIGSAINIWSSGCSGMMGRDFPTLRNNASGQINITVDRLGGRNPESNAGCARFNHRLDSQLRVIGGTIEIYEQDSAGNDCLWVMPAVTLDNLIAHEIGHVLGLANSTCTNHIMGPNWATSNPASDECAWVDDAWQTTTEQQQDACDATCSTTCTGTPPTCPSGSGGTCGVEGCPPGAYDDPLILDLEGDGIETTSVSNGVDFDVSGDGVRDRTAWTKAGADDAFLYFDENENDVVDGAAELFGDATTLADGTRARNGYEALAARDDPRHGGNGDGVITKDDKIWRKLRLWIDANHDGVTTREETFKLHEFDIVEIALSYVVMTSADDFGVDSAGNWHLIQGQFVQRSTGDGPPCNRIRPIHDVFFRVELR